MKIVFTITLVVLVSCFCSGQAEDTKTVYSMKKDISVIGEEKSGKKEVTAEERKSRTSVSMYKNHTSSDAKEPVPKTPNEKEGKKESMLKSKTEGTKKVEKERR